VVPEIQNLARLPIAVVVGIMNTLFSTLIPVVFPIRDQTSHALEGAEFAKGYQE
jgi:hypothetical protein